MKRKQNTGSSFIEKTVIHTTNADSIYDMYEIQSLWGGYGHLYRAQLEGADTEQIIIKHVSFPDKKNRKQDISHKRKVRSYQVEINWYNSYSARCTESCRVPGCYAVQSNADEILLLLEDLDYAGYPERHYNGNRRAAELGLRWLAEFHALFMQTIPDGLWKTGTYWHLGTRPDELQRLTDLPLKKAAQAIDTALRRTPYQTIVHGDAKLENFCFTKEMTDIAAVDFQYTGGGCGMKDVAYFLGSCFSDDVCEKISFDLVDCYFTSLRSALIRNSSGIDCDHLESEWRRLYPVAWTDFYRFYKGWAPGSWNQSDYSERTAREVITMVQENS